MGFIQKVSSALEEFRTRWAGFHFAWRARGEKELSTAAPQSPASPQDHALSLFGKALPSSGSGAEARVDAVPASGPRKLPSPLFMTKGRMTCLILVVFGLL